MKKAFMFFMGLVCALSVISCTKYKTSMYEIALVSNPGQEKPEWIANSKINRGEYVIVKDEKEINGKKFLQVQIVDTDIIGWAEEKFWRDGQLQTITIVNDADVYMRPSDKSDKIARALAGQIALEIERKDDFVHIDYPGVDGYVLASYIGDGAQVVKTVFIPGLGKASITASSTYSSGDAKEIEYDPRKAFDGSLQTAWIEGKPGDDGVGEYISLTFDQYVTITGVSVVNGWAASEELYKLNNRVAELGVTSDGGSSINLDLEDENYDYQSFDRPISGRTFKFIINKVYKGTDSDTTISEIRLTGAPVGMRGY